MTSVALAGFRLRSSTLVLLVVLLLQHLHCLPRENVQNGFKVGEALAFLLVYEFAEKLLVAIREGRLSTNSPDALKQSRIISPPLSVGSQFFEY